MHALAQLPDLKVTARTSSFFFKGQDIDAREIARKLGVSTVLEGSVQRDANRVRIVAQLIEAETGFHFWSKTYDRELSDLFTIQDDTAMSVAAAMKVTLTDAINNDGGKIESVGTDNVAAYEKYLKGLQQKNMGGNVALLLAEISFKEALALDPGYYEARLELAYTFWGQQSNGAITRAEASEHVRPLLDRLREERPDDELTLALDARVQGYGSIDVEEHLAELTAAIKRAPNEARLYQALAMLLRFANRREEAIEWLDRGIAVDPLEPMLHGWRGVYLLWAGDVDGAEASFARVIELNPDNPSVYAWVGNISWHHKQYVKWFAMWIRGMELDPLDYEFPAHFALNLYTFGLMDEGDKYLQRAIAIAPDKVTVRAMKLYRLVLLDDYSRARELSETLLRDDIDARRSAYELAVMVFVSTMAELGKTDEALTVLEELRPGISSIDFHPRSIKEHVLQYHSVLALAQSQSREETLSMLDAVVPRWDKSFPDWRDDPGQVAPIEMARGQTKTAARLSLESLERRIGLDLPNGFPYLLYRHIDYYKALAQEPVVAERLADLDAEAKQAGEDVWAYIVEHELQL
jgi:tetratricopeptide (TPR) repeat protein